MSDISIIRHMSIFNPVNYSHPVHLIGCGATGSRIFMSLVELGCQNIICYDFDVIEPHNLANQAFLYEHVGMPKVEALRHLYELKTGCKPPDTMQFHQTFVGDEFTPELEGVVFLLTDTMASRKQIYDRCISDKTELLIETRMASTHGNIFGVTPEHFDAWFETLGEDGDLELSPCGTPISVGMTASIIANLAVWRYIMHCTDALSATHTAEVYLKPFIVTTGDFQNGQKEGKQHDEQAA